MFGLIPFNKRNELETTNLFNVLDGFFQDSWPLISNGQLDSFKLDVKENDSAYLIEAELPGVKKEAINIACLNSKLTISVNQTEEKNEDQGHYLHRERRQKSMQRSVFLNESIQEGITAGLKEGILNIVVPKKSNEEKIHQIEIN